MAMEGVGDLVDSSWDEGMEGEFWERDGHEADEPSPLSTDGMGMSDPGIPGKPD